MRLRLILEGSVAFLALVNTGPQGSSRQHIITPCRIRAKAEFLFCHRRLLQRQIPSSLSTQHAIKLKTRLLDSHSALFPKHATSAICGGVGRQRKSKSVDLLAGRAIYLGSLVYARKSVETESSNSTHNIQPSTHHPSAFAGEQV